MAKLDEKEIKQFYKIQSELVLFANSRFNIVRNLPRPTSGAWDPEEIYKIINEIFSKPEIIDSFCNENPANLNREEIEIARSWKNFVKDRFIVFLKDNKTIFLNSSEGEPKIYEVYGLYDEITDIVPFTPIIMDTVLVPFNKKIVYIGLCETSSVYFGGGFKKILEKDFMKAKSKYGIISSLEEPITEKDNSKEELLKFYLKNKKNREKFWDEICDILNENPSLKDVFYRELGRSSVRKIKHVLLQIGVERGWFAVSNSQILTSGNTRKEVNKRLKEILPEDKLSRVHVFEYKGGNKK